MFSKKNFRTIIIIIITTSRFAKRKWSEKAPCHCTPQSSITGPSRKFGPLPLFFLGKFSKWSKFHQNRMAFNFIWDSTREMKLAYSYCFYQANLHKWSKFHQNRMYLNFGEGGSGAVTPIAPLHRHLENFDNLYMFFFQIYIYGRNFTKIRNI